MCNWLFQMAVNMAFEPLLAATSTATTFGVSLVVMVFALGFIHAFLPETRGLEGEEIVTYDICSMQQVQTPFPFLLHSLNSLLVHPLTGGDWGAQWPRRCCSRDARARDRRLQEHVLSEGTARSDGGGELAMVEATPAGGGASPRP